MGFGQAVELAAYVVGRCGAAGIVHRTAVLLHSQQGQPRILPLRESPRLGVGGDAVAQRGVELAALEIHNRRVDRFEIGA